MSGPSTPERISAILPMVCTTALLAMGAAVTLAWSGMALHQDDIEAVESPLVLSVARQIELGPGSLYGPYGGGYPLVLIHAPLYYRLTALGAWPICRAGFDPALAALISGRTLSTLGFLAALAAAYRMARLGGLPRRGGWWAVLLVAATPVCASVPFEVRPDMLGIGLQTTGILVVVAAIMTVPIGESWLTASFGCFALAACIKQHFVVAPLVSLVLLLGAWARGRLGLVPILRSLALFLAIVVVYYGMEEWLTAGRMSRSIVIAASSAGQVHPADWFAAINLLLALIWKCQGLILLLAAAGLAIVSVQPGIGRGIFVSLATALIGALAALALVQFFLVQMHITFLLVFGLIVLMTLVMPACARLDRSPKGGSLEVALWAFCAAEMALTLILWRQSTGGWFNYAFQAVVIACILTARGLERAFGGAASSRSLIPIVLAALAVPAFAWTDLNQITRQRAVETARIARVVDAAERSAAGIFFVDRPGANRIHGRLDLVYDPWLYPVFESIGAAEPRSIWLEQALSTGPVRVVATTSPRARIDGLKRTLPELGYRLKSQAGPYFVWARPSQQAE
jgi:hypothetical protein